MRLPVVLGLLVLAPLAGCFGGDEPPALRAVTASGGVVTLGWAYGGEPVIGRDATLDGVLNDPENTGIVNVSFTINGTPWTATVDSFAQASGKDFQDGGIAFALDEHGDTGVADASIPRIHALVAAWGSARVMRGDALATSEPWSAHLMVSADTVRGTDGKITKADGATPYDPGAPGDARRVEGDAQALMFLKHPQGETFAREPTVEHASLTCTGPACAQTAEVPFEAGATTAVVNVTIGATQDPLPTLVGRGTVRVLDGNGTELQRSEFEMAPTGRVLLSFEIDLSAAVAPLAVEVAGSGAYTALIDATIAYDDVPFIVLTWDEVTLA